MLNAHPTSLWGSVLIWGPLSSSGSGSLETQILVWCIRDIDFLLPKFCNLSDNMKIPCHNSPGQNSAIHDIIPIICKLEPVVCGADTFLQHEVTKTISPLGINKVF